MLSYPSLNYSACVISSSTMKVDPVQKCAISLRLNIKYVKKIMNIYLEIYEDNKRAILRHLFYNVKQKKQNRQQYECQETNDVRCTGVYNVKVRELKSKRNFGYLEPMDISKFGRSHSKFELLIFHFIYKIYYKKIKICGPAHLVMI